MKTVRPAGRLSERNCRTAAALSAEIGPYGCAAELAAFPLPITVYARRPARRRVPEGRLPLHGMFRRGCPQVLFPGGYFQ